MPAASRLAHGENYPTRPVRIIEGFGGGSTPDLVSRLIGQWLAARLGQAFVVEERTGAGSNIATEAVVTASPDGYTLLNVVTANAINATLYEKLDFDFIRDIAPVAGLIRFPMVLLVNPSVPANTLTDLFAGQIQAFIITVSTAIGSIKAGKVRALAVTGATRSGVLPDVPTVSELLPGFEATAWNGIGAPKATPGAIVHTLSTNITAGLADATLKARINDVGGETVPMPSAEFASFIVEETEKWAKVVKFSGAKVN